MAYNSKIIKCPACQKEMVKVFIPSEGINLDICLNGCGGIYFDNREFSHFDEQNENIDDIIKALDGKTFLPVDETLTRNCPVCGATMVKNNVGLTNGVTVDDCYSCGGKFLDFGELQEIRAQYSSNKERSEDFRNEILNATRNEEIKDIIKGKGRSSSHMKKFFDKMVNRIV